jgi:hypothetical protein
MWRPLNDVLTSSWVSAETSRFSRTRDVRLSNHPFARDRHRRSRADDRPLLGPRSLPPPLFLERCVGAYSGPGCCLPTSATEHDERTLSTGLPFPRRDDGHDHLPFLTCRARPSRVAPKSGDTRRAAHSSVDLDPGAGSLPLSWVCPTAISEPTRHLFRLRLSPPTREFSDD